MLKRKESSSPLSDVEGTPGWKMSMKPGPLGPGSPRGPCGPGNPRGPCGPGGPGGPGGPTIICGKSVLTPGSDSWPTSPVEAYRRLDYLPLLKYMLYFYVGTACAHSIHNYG